MKVWTNNMFKGFWPVGTAAVVVVNTSEEAAMYLNEQLKTFKLKETAYAKDMHKVPLIKDTVIMLNDGNY